jgi:hypothetical protein
VYVSRWPFRRLPDDETPRLVARLRNGFEATATVRPTALVLHLRTARVRAAEGAVG